MIWIRSTLIAWFAIVLLNGAWATAQDTGAVFSSHHTSPKAIALHLSDLPGGWLRIRDGFYTPTEAAKANRRRAQTYIHHGWLVTYESTFQRSQPIGLFRMDDSVLEFASSKGARWARSELLHQSRVGFRKHHPRTSRLPGLGTDGEELKFRERANGYPLTVNAVFFRQGRYAITVLGLGLTGSFQSGATLRYARVMDSRAREAH